MDGTERVVAPGVHALYEGVVWHRRFDPPHHFRQRTTMAWLDLDHLDTAAAVPWCGTQRWSPIRFRRSDFYGDTSQPPAEAARDRVLAELGTRPDGPVYVLANLRTWGWCFNPIAVYWCFDTDGRPVAELLVVTNTPWHERHVYVIDRRTHPAPGPVTFDKAMHVSPFFPMDLGYRFEERQPGERVSMRLDVTADRGAGGVVFSGGFEGRRRSFDGAGVRRLLLRTPTQRVSAGIHIQAARLWRKGATFVPHPDAAHRQQKRSPRWRARREQQVPK